MGASYTCMAEVMARPREVIEVNKMVAITYGIIRSLPVHFAFDCGDMVVVLQDNESFRVEVGRLFKTEDEDLCIRK